MYRFHFTSYFLDGSIKINKIVYHPHEEIGTGSYDTKGFKGVYEKRDIAVKRLCRDKFISAYRELDMLRSSDQHKNVLHYYATEKCKKYLYIALQRCEANLDDFISGKYKNDQVNGMKIVGQALKGLKFLHELKPPIIHLNIKPSNILIGIQNGDDSPIGIISDLGLDKQLQFYRDPAEYVSGWMAPELLRQMYNVNKAKKNNTTTKVDVFASGVLIHYTKTSGKHLFGETLLERDEKVLNNEYDFENIDSVMDCSELNLIQKMISTKPDKRPSTSAVLNHVTFWPKKRILEFFRKTSDFSMKEDPNLLAAIEKGSIKVISSDWISSMDQIIENKIKSNKKCKYDGTKVKFLLRAIRNYANHYNEITKDEQVALGSLDDEFVTYWLTRFPNLLLHIFKAFEPWKSASELKEFYDQNYNFA